jgi:hypothetical protein
MNKFYTFLILSLISSLIFSCNGDNNQALKTTDLIGSWECVGGSLNGEPNPLFAKTENNPGAIIELTTEVMTFELLFGQLGTSVQQAYSLEENKIVCTNDKNIVFEIEEINKEEGTLTLVFSAEGHDFVMEMERK